MAKLLKPISLLFLCAFCDSSYALNNEDKGVWLVESLIDSKRVFLHLSDTTDARPSCARAHKIIACSLTDVGCEQALSIALAAKLSDKKIDFQLTGECIGTIPKFDRLRIQ